ncbi:lipopolysaccharide assembly protein LapA domain-containing protein [Balnearium lithotrophicum]|uniref:lipopolysaccharide assembly protein LapA domain-containing protein n=1 Tax=Balnearium lithotrophicum TaxID=223788 RepID=UPI00115CD8FE|nr:LapA family protein [Balnearium lithotrophicum]
MTLKQYFYSVVVTSIVLAVSLFALQNFQDVEVTIPFIGVFKTKLFVVIVFSFFSGFLTAGFLSLIFKIFSIPSNIKRKREKNVEDRPVSKGSENSKEEKSGKGAL